MSFLYKKCEKVGEIPDLPPCLRLFCAQREHIYTLEHLAAFCGRLAPPASTAALISGPKLPVAPPVSDDASIGSAVLHILQRRLFFTSFLRTRPSQREGISLTLGDASALDGISSSLRPHLPLKTPAYSALESGGVEPPRAPATPYLPQVPCTAWSEAIPSTYGWPLSTGFRTGSPVLRVTGPMLSLNPTETFNIGLGNSRLASFITAG